MPRSLVVGNGNVLVGFDPLYEVRDIFFPRVGQWNQTLGNRCRTGLFVDGRMAWLADPGWERRLGYIEDTLVTEVELRHAEIGLTLRVHDYVDMYRDHFVRRLEVDADRPLGVVRAFFHFDWFISESDIGCTVLYDPRHRAVVAYKDDHYFLIGGQAGTEHGVHSWATGKKGNGAAGTWVDAEDGNLSGNAIEQGSVDCTIGFDLGPIEAGSRRHLHQWVCMGRRLAEVTEFGQDLIVTRGEQNYRDRTQTYWHVWSEKDRRGVELELGDEVRRLYRRSLLTVRSHIDNRGGAIAASDYDIAKFARDTYAYVWPRDGAIAANSLDRAGHEDITRRFFDFCRSTLVEEGYFLHKYTPAGYPGSSWHPWIDHEGHRVLPVQEDETGLVLWALWQHYETHHNLDFVVELYTSLVVPAAQWMIDYTDPESGLPLPSWDLWEERWGVHAFTVGAVWGGLRAARDFAELFGDTETAGLIRPALDRLRAAADRLLHREELGRFARRLTPGPGGLEADAVVDSALHGLWRFGMYEVDEPRMVATMAAVADRLTSRAECGGVARYEADRYFQVEPDTSLVPGNPWFICSLWLAQWQVATARTFDDLKGARDTLGWVVAHQLPGGLLSEQLDPHTGAPVSVSPLSWSHAEFVITVADYMERVERLAAAAAEAAC